VSNFQFEDKFTERLTGTLHAPGASVGDVPTAQADGSLLMAAGGGSQPGAVRVLRHDFDFTQAAALAVGVPVWTPAVDDWLVDAWIESDDPGWTADGEVLPLADIGIIDGGAWADDGGFFNRAIGPVDVSQATWTVGTKYVFASGAAMRLSSLLAGAMSVAGLVGGVSTPLPLFKFLTTDPLSLVVSSDGTPSGTAFDGSAGTSTLFIEVCTPEDAA
jgi:hypothetical protein